jgi:hypothetical protein
MRPVPADAGSCAAAAEGTSTALIDFGDSHTYFLPPEVPATCEYGWQMAMVGDRCLVLGVKPGSDAEGKGLRAGDHILEIETLRPTRADLWKMRYSPHLLNPRRRVRLVAQTPGGSPRPLDIETKVTPRPKEIRVNIDSLMNGITCRAHRLGGALATWRPPLRSRREDRRPEGQEVHEAFNGEERQEPLPRPHRRTRGLRVGIGRGDSGARAAA